MLLKELGEEATYYYHPDHLGSVSVVSNHRGEPYERVEYLPFGEIWIEETDPATGYIPFRFTSKELDEETGLYYYGARYYEPTTSRWMSPDPAGFGLINPMDSDGKLRADYSVIEALNWYAYVSNNPVKYVDPTGEIHIVSGNKEEGYTVTIPVQFKGRHWTDERKKEFEEDVESRWSGEFNGASFTVDVVETNKGKRNKIRLKNKEGRSYVRNGKRLILFMDDMTKDKSTMAHEAGHLMDLRDRYTDEEGKGSVAHEGWEDNIMGTGSLVEQRNREEIIGKEIDVRRNNGEQFVRMDNI